MNKTSKQLAEEVVKSGGKVRFFYERYAQVKDIFRVDPIYACDIPIISKTPLSLSELRAYQMDVHPRGGRVTAEITDKDGKQHVSVAECSLYDVFDKEIGKKIALGRAIKESRK